jgi:hypothetical protein
MSWSRQQHKSVSPPRVGGQLISRPVRPFVAIDHHEKTYRLGMPMKQFFNPESILEYLPKVLTALTVLASIGVILGATVTVRYCTRINFFPSGISVGDSFFLIWVSAGFALICGMFVFLSSGTAVLLLCILRPIVNRVFSLLGRDNQKKLPPISEIGKVYHLLLGAGLGAPLVVLILFRSRPEMLWGLSVLVLLFAFIFGFTILRRPIDPPQPKVHSGAIDEQNVWSRIIRYAMVPFLLTVILIYPEVGGALSEVTMRFVGIRINHADIAVDGQVAEYMRTVLSNQSISPKTDKNCTNPCIIYDVTILWTGIGSNLLVSLGQGRNSVRFVLPSSQVLVAY